MERPRGPRVNEPGDNSQEATTPGPAAPGPEARVDALRLALRRLRAFARAQLMLQRAGVIIAAALGVVLALGLLDYVFRLPTPLRMTMWLFGLAALLWFLYRRVIPAAGFLPSLSQVALRVEASPAGRAAGLEGVLTSGLELSGERAGEARTSRELRRAAVADAAQRFRGVRRWTIFLAPRELLRALAGLGAVAAPMLALGVLAPDMSAIGWSRVATPWSGAQWPKRTAVAAADHPIAHAAGTPLPLRALLTRATRGGGVNLGVEYRVIADGKPGPLRRALLTSQNRVVTMDLTREGDQGRADGASSVSGVLYERLLETSGLGSDQGGGAGQVALEFAFTTPDDRTSLRRVLLVEPPELLGAAARVEPPAYASGVMTGDSGYALGRRELGKGRDERAVLGPILAGSSVELELTLSRPLPTPRDQPGLDEWMARVLPGLSGQRDLAARFDGNVWTISFTADRTLRSPVALVDNFGIVAAEESVFRLEVAEDRAATAAVVEPPADESVLATAVVDAVGEGRDDVALAWTSLSTQIARPPAGSTGAAPEPLGDPGEVARALPEGGTKAGITRAKASHTLDLTPLELSPGDEVWLTARAMDVLSTSTGGEAALSAPRRLRVIAESEFVEQLRAELSGVREAAKRLATDQKRLSERNDAAKGDAGLAEAQAKAQAGVGQRLNPMGDALRRLSERVDRNRLADESIPALLEAAQGHLDAGGDASDRAGAGLGDLANEGTPDAQRDEAGAKALAAQREVEEELSALADLLDRGNDAWAVRRQLEKLLTEQKQLRAQTQAAGEAMAGATREDLTQNQKDDLARLARRQEDAARNADALVESLLQRAQQMRQGDPAQAQAMQGAANKAQQSQLADAQRRAARQIGENQTAGAQDLQQQAEEAIEDVLEELDRVEQRRDEALRRVLADLVESIEQLIRRQAQELARLEEAQKGAVPATLDAGMISLNQNTLSVVETAREEVRGAASLLGLLGAAAEAQGLGIAALRGADLPNADAQERVSLAKLKEALAEAEKLSEDAEEEEAARKRAELRKVYAEMSEVQAGLNAVTEPLIGENLTRRQRSEAMSLGEQQGALRERLSQLKSGTQDLSEAALFSFAHDRYDQAAARAAAALSKGVASTAVGFDQQAALRTLQALVQALTDPPKQEDFREEEGGDGGGGGGGGGQKPLIPPLAELKLLRAMQGEAAELTVRLHESTDPDAAAQMESLAALQTELARQATELLKKLNEEPGEEAPEAEVVPIVPPREYQP